jgi:succinoglycan biosynthesis protein ExoM
MNHISVCICTYKRPQLLKRVLERLDSQATEGQFTFSIVVADNDQLKSGEKVVSEVAKASRVPIKYCWEPQQNISLARNKAIENATGEYIAFLDDDELPTERWLLTLLNACRNCAVDGVLGSAKPQFDGEPPAWVVKGKFFERAAHKTGSAVEWNQGRTGNVLLKSCLFKYPEPAFRPEVRAGEDQDFFRRMIQKGHRFIWCNEALTNEVIPPVRWSRSYVLGRALLNGKFAIMHPNSRRLDNLKSIGAVVAYTLALPFVFFAGQHVFVRYLVKIMNHVGKLLMLVGVDPMTDQRAAGLYPEAAQGIVDHPQATG